MSQEATAFPGGRGAGLGRQPAAMGVATGG